MTKRTSALRDSVSVYLVAAAALWSVLLLAVGSVLLVAENGVGVVVILSVPLVLVGLFALVNVVRCARGKRGPGPIAWAIVALSGIFALLGILTIGTFVAPVPVLLAIASGRLQERQEDS